MSIFIYVNMHVKILSIYKSVKIITMEKYNQQFRFELILVKSKTFQNRLT